MRIAARWFTAACIASLLGAGCIDGGNRVVVVGDKAQPEQDEPSSALNEEPAEAPSQSTTTTTEPPSEVVEPEEPKPQGPRAPLTGIASPRNTEIISTPAFVAKIGNNNEDSRPQIGLAQADVVYEQLIESLKTRFMAIFHSDIPATFGPVRSARTTDVNLIAGLGKPVFIYSGANDFTLGALRQVANGGRFVNMGASGVAVPYYRLPTRQAPYNLMATPTNVDISRAGIATPVLQFDTDAAISTSANVAEGLGTTAAAEGEASSVAGAGDLEEVGGGAEGSGGAEAGGETGAGGGGEVSGDVGASGGAESGGQPTGGVEINYQGGGARKVAHLWDSEIRGWVRIQDSTLHTTLNGDEEVEIAPTNVVVLSVVYRVSPADRATPEAVSFSNGRAQVFTNGKVIEGTWSRSLQSPQWTLRNQDGEAILLTPGRTWLILASGVGSRFSQAEVSTILPNVAANRLAEARAAHYAR